MKKNSVGMYGYASNTRSDTINGYSIQKGSLVLLNANGITATAGTSPGDISLSNNSVFI